MGYRQKQDIEQPSWMDLLIFALNYNKLVIESEVESQEKEKQRFGKLLLTIAALRAFLALRSAVTRTYNYHKIEYGPPEDPVYAFNATSTSDYGHDHIDAPVAGTSLLYLPLLLMELGLLIAGRKEFEDKEKLNKFIFEVSDCLVWAPIHILRLDGRWIEELDARVWAGDWADITSTSGQSILLAGYGLELIYQVSYDYSLYQKNEEDLQNIDDKINNTVDPNTLLQYQVQKTELLRKKSQIMIMIAADAVHLTCMVIGIGVTMATTAPAGLLLMVIATAANQLKNILVSIDDYLHTLTKCYNKSLYLDKLEKMDSYEIASSTEEINSELTKLGMSRLGLFSDDERISYLKKQRRIINNEMRAANKNLVLDMTWYGFILTTIAFLAFGNPIGFAALILGLAAYGLLKTGFYVRDQIATEYTCLNSFFITKKSDNNSSANATLSPSIYSC